MIALKWVTSNMPKLETVKVPPWNSCGCNFPSLALAASALTSFEMFSMPLRSALKTIGVMSPLSVETATDTSTASNLEGSENVNSAMTQVSVHSLSDDVAEPGRVDFRHLLACNGGGLDDEVIYGQLGARFFQGLVEAGSKL